MRINHNIAALNTYRQLGTNSAGSGKSLEKLSSGLRINRAGDDAAGLAISEKMRAQIRGLNQASRNAQDGISMIQTTEGALAESQSILQRMRELANQSANDTNVNVDRDEIQKEMNQLTSEINRIGNTTEFNAQKLLKGKDVAVTATTAASTTVTQGAAGVVQGAVSNLVTGAKSVVASSSTSSVQASTSAATGEISSSVTETTASVKGVKSSLTLTNGITFESDVTADKFNQLTSDNVKIEIQQATGSDQANKFTYDSASQKYTFVVGTDNAGNSKATNRGELVNVLNTMINNGPEDLSGNPVAFGTDQKFKVANPSGTDAAVVDVTGNGTFTGGVQEVKGDFSLDITKAFKEAGDTINIEGQAFKAVLGPADASKRQFQVDNTVAFKDAGFSVGYNLAAGAGAVAATAAVQTGTAIADGTNFSGSGALKINGTTVNLTAVSALGAVADADGTPADSTLIQNALQTDINSALGAGKFTVGVAAGVTTITSVATGTAAKIDLAGSDAASAAKLGLTTAAATPAFGTQGRALHAAIGASTTATFNVDGTDYTISNAKLTGAGGFDGSTSEADIKALIEGAVDSNGHTLKEKATVDITDHRLSITSNSKVSTSQVSFKVNGGVTADETSVGAAFGLTHNAVIKQSDLQAASLVAAIKANPSLSDRFTVTNPLASGQTTSSKLEFVENLGKATGNVLQLPTVSGAGTNDKLVATNAGGDNLKKINLVQATAQSAAAAKSNIIGTSLTVGTQFTAGSDGTELNGVKISFSGTSAGAMDSTTKAAWDANTQTLTLSGKFNDATDITKVVKQGLLDAGFDTTNVNGITMNAVGGFTATGANLDGKTATFGGDLNSGAVIGQIATSKDTLAVSQNNGDLTIYLASNTASKNTAAEIEKAVKALGDKGYTGGIDFSKFSFKAEGNWDTNTVGNSLTKDIGTLVGGTAEVKGQYSFEVTDAFKAGDIVEIKGQRFTAVDSGADAAKGQFNVASGNVNAQAAGIADAISLNSNLSNYDVKRDGFTLTLTEKAATGKDLDAKDLAVKATGVQGEYSIKVDELVKDGGSFLVDGKEIKVSSKEAHVGYANGTAIKETGDAKAQVQALADAVNKNADLNKTYTASVSDAGELVLKQQEGSATTPEVKVNTSPKGNFTASFQVGANSGQSMTIEVEDMRSNALNVSGDGSNDTVQAKNGAVASFVKTANVNNGTTQANVEFSLDVSTHEKASAAISVINDAIEKVSSQRSQLGAFQNRLEHTINNLDTSSENLQAAESRIRDVDMAKEMMEFTKNNILSQAAQAMLAQANQQPQGVLQLLR